MKFMMILIKANFLWRFCDGIFMIIFPCDGFVTGFPIFVKILWRLWRFCDVTKIFEKSCVWRRSIKTRFLSNTANYYFIKFWLKIEPTFRVISIKFTFQKNFQFKTKHLYNNNIRFFIKAHSLLLTFNRKFIRIIKIKYQL